MNPRAISGMHQRATTLAPNRSASIPVGGAKTFAAMFTKIGQPLMAEIDHPNSRDKGLIKTPIQ